MHAYLRYLLIYLRMQARVLNTDLHTSPSLVHCESYHTYPLGPPQLLAVIKFP
jgi:hypothetical protein